jgi:hypothetical protein
MELAQVQKGQFVLCRATVEFVYESHGNYNQAIKVMRRVLPRTWRPLTPMCIIVGITKKALGNYHGSVDYYGDGEQAYLDVTELKTCIVLERLGGERYRLPELALPEDLHLIFTPHFSKPLEISLEDWMKG